jgi:NTE family protein
MAKTRSRALVLGGGGVAGIAWETGVLFGLAEAGIDLLAADLIVGTSAGAAVAAQITSGSQLAELYDRHAFPQGETTELAVEFDPEKMMAELVPLLADRAPGSEMRAAVGGYALAAPTVPERRRREVIEARLPSHKWPDRALQIVAVDAATGEERIFTPDDAETVELVDAVAASCAVPGIWPPVTIGGRRYLDGGMRSSANLDLAADHDVVLALAPVADIGPLEAEIAKTTARVEKRKGTVVVRPDEESTAAMGANPLDPETARPAAQAGRAQAASIADEVRALWSDAG